MLGPNGLKGNKSRGFGPMHLSELLKYIHLQLQLRISHQWFTRKTLLNTYLNFMGHAILLDQSLPKFDRQIKIYLYTPIPVCQYHVVMMFAPKLVCLRLCVGSVYASLPQ